MRKLTSNDPGLSELAARLKTLSWADQLDQAEQDHCRALAMEGARPGEKVERQRVAPYPGGTTWQVRMFLGGEQRTLGIVDATNVQAAFRFSDLAASVFWKYRVRRSHPPTADQLNLTPDRLDRDLQAEGEAMSLLRQIEEYLLQSGAIQSPEQRQLARLEQRARNRGALKQAVQINHMELLERLEGLFTAVTTLNGVTASLVQNQLRLEKAVESLRTEVARLPLPVAGTVYTAGGTYQPPQTGAPLPPNPVTFC